MEKIVFEDDLTDAQREILRRVREGELIHLETRDDGNYYFYACGSTINKWSVERLLNGGYIEPANDGLFDGFAQTLVAKDG